jgi:hypothetical protein
MMVGEHPVPSGTGVGKMKENFSNRLAGNVISPPVRLATLLIHALSSQRNLESV